MAGAVQDLNKKGQEAVSYLAFIKLLARPAGLEPATYGFEVRIPDLHNLLLITITQLNCWVFRFPQFSPISLIFADFTKKSHTSPHNTEPCRISPSKMNLRYFI